MGDQIIFINERNYQPQMQAQHINLQTHITRF